MTADQLRSAIELAKTGETHRARTAFLAIIKEDPGEVIAWLWLADMIESRQEKIILLERCLKINPLNPMVQDALAHFKEEVLAPPIAEQPLQADAPESEPETIPQPADIHSRYQQEEKITASRHSVSAGRLLTALLLMLITAGLVFGWRQLKQWGQALLDQAPTPTTAQGMGSAATWTPQSTSTPTITPTPTPQLPLAFGSELPAPAAPITAQNASALVEFARWEPGVLLGVQWLPDGTLLARSSRGFEQYTFPEGVASFLLDTEQALTASSASPDGEWVLFTSAEGGLTAARSSAADASLRLDDANKPWKFVDVGNTEYLATAVNEQSELNVWQLPGGELLYSLPAVYGNVTSLAVSPDATKLAIGNDGGYVWLLDAHSGEELQRVFDLEGSIDALAFSPDGSKLAAAGSAQTIAVWDTATGKIHHHIYQEIANVTAIHYSDSGNQIAIGLSTGDILLWDDEKRQMQDQYSRHHAAIVSLSFSDSSTLASAARDGNIYFWDLSASISYQSIYSGVEGSIFASAITPNGQYLLLAGSDSQIHVIDLASNTEVAALKGHIGSIYSLAISKDGAYLLSGGRDGSVRLWSLSKFEAIATLGSHEGFVRSVAFSTDQTLAASGASDEMIKLWDLTLLQEKQTLVGHTGHVQSVDFSADDSQLISSGDDGSIRLWEAATGKLLQTLQNPDGQPVYAAQFLADGSRCVSGDASANVSIWNLETQQIELVLRGHESAINALTLSHDGSILVSADAAGRLIFWETNNLERIRTFDEHTDPLVAAAFSANGKAFFSTDRSGRVLRWDSAGWKPPIGIQNYASPLAAAAISPDGALLALAGVDHSIRVFDRKTGTLQYQIRGLESGINIIQFSPGETHLAAGFVDGSVQVWESSTGFHEATFTQDSEVTALTFEPDGRVLLIGYANHTIQRQQLNSDSAPELLTGHGAPITSLTMAPNGVTLASGSQEGVIILWDMDDNSILHRINAHQAAVTGLQFSSDGVYLYSASTDGAISQWRVTNGKEELVWSGEQPHHQLWIDSQDSFLSTASGDLELCFWDLASQSASPCLTGQTSQPVAAWIDAQNTFLLTVETDASVHQYSIIESKLPEEIPTPLPTASTTEQNTQPEEAQSPVQLPASLYYLSDKSGSTQIWRLEADGITTSQITNEEAGITAYDVSPVADHIVYVSGNQLILIDKAAQNRWILVESEMQNPVSLNERLQYEINSPVFSPDGWRVAYGLNGVHIYSILDNTDEQLVENWLDEKPSENEAHLPIFFSPGGYNLYVRHTASGGASLLVLNSWTGEVFTESEIGPGWQPMLSADEASVIFTGMDQHNQATGLWMIDVWFDKLTQILPLPNLSQSYQINAFPKQAEDGSFFFFYAQSEPKQRQPALILASAADDGTSLLHVIRSDSYINLQEALWANDASFVLVVDPADHTIKKLRTSDTPPIQLPISGTMLKWGE